jgi:small basic protein (TIGR04137 family)
MTMDKSLKSSNKLVRRRNVLKRDERVARLEDDGKWEEGMSVFGMSKLKVQTHVTKAGKKEKKVAEAESAEGAATAGAEE